MRDFFLTRQYLEVETPLLSPNLIPESSLEIFKTNRISPDTSSHELYLIPSPEIWMKQLLSQELGSHFQICKCFRNSEQSGRIHSNEFSMLEWYGVDLTFQDNIDLTQDLFRFIAPLAKKEERHFFLNEFLILSMDQAFEEYAGFSLTENSTHQALCQQLDRLKLHYKESDNLETLFNRIFLTLVEPELPEDRTVILTDYPSFIPTLAQTHEDSPTSERWEMYMKGIELANCYSEEKDQKKVSSYFSQEVKEKKKQAHFAHAVDHQYADLFHDTFPIVSGVAMGMDRLLMALSGAKSIEEVLLFP